MCMIRVIRHSHKRCLPDFLPFISLHTRAFALLKLEVATKLKGRSYNRATTLHFQTCSACLLEENGEWREGGGEERGG